MAVLMISKTSKRKRLLSKGIADYILALMGILALIFSIVYVSSILAFIGLGLTFWGFLFLYLKRERYVKSTVLDSTAAPSLETLSKIITELDFNEWTMHYSIWVKPHKSIRKGVRTRLHPSRPTLLAE